MALTGLHVACGYAGGRGPSSSYGNGPPPPNMALLGKALWSETMAAAGTTTSVAPAAGAPNGTPVMSVRSSADAWIAIGPTPNAATGPRRYLPASTDLDLFVEPGDKLAWILA